MIVSEYGTELTSNAVLVWYGDIGVEWHYIAPRQSGSYRFVGRISIDKRAYRQCLIS
jgi:putative transposase